MKRMGGERNITEIIKILENHKIYNQPFKIFRTRPENMKIYVNLIHLVDVMNIFFEVKLVLQTTLHWSSWLLSTQERFVGLVV